MITGIVLIVSGILIAVYPPLLSLVVAMLFIVMGSIFCSISYRIKKMENRFQDPFMDFFKRT